MLNNKVLGFVEWGAVVANLLYTFLYIQGSSSCFLWGILGPLLLLVLCVNRKLYADSFLQVVYVGLAIYGWTHWGQAGWEQQAYSGIAHCCFIGIALLGGLAIGFLLKKYSNAQLPFVDSIIMAGFLVATWLMMNFVHENWLYFIVLNAASIVLYTNRRLHKTAVLFAIYLLMSIDAYWHLGFFAA